MFSIAAINDTDSKSQWEPLAPTKEAKEFHLSQTYHEGLAKLQDKDYDKARELLESVLKDPLVANAGVNNGASDSHLLQLRFLALKNLAFVFLQQGPNYHDNALQCYLQAVEIDYKDSVVWNKLGTLSCTMGLFSISRWAFEQGLECSPNNWNCMEKLLEVLIAIGDEVSCLSVAELILRHWPSHSRALHVKETIEESEPMPFSPRGIDKLEPRHATLKFPEKRKAENTDLNEGTSSKRLKQDIKLHLSESSWITLAGELLNFLCPSVNYDSEVGPDRYQSGNIRVSVELPNPAQNIMGPTEKKECIFSLETDHISSCDCNVEKCSAAVAKASATLGEQPQERRSSRLERLRSQKPGKEEADLKANKDLAKVVMQFLGPYVEDRRGTKLCKDSANCDEITQNLLDAERANVISFVKKTSKNYGAYHMGHLLLEEVASTGILYQDTIVKILDLEKLTRHWGKERTPACSIFLAEICHDFAVQSTDKSMIAAFMSEASYHICKIIEYVALNFPLHIISKSESESYPSLVGPEPNCEMLAGSNLDLIHNYPFWVRFFWLSGRLSIFEGDREKARRELSSSLALLTNKFAADDSRFVCLPHCKVTKKLTVDAVLHEINLLEVDFLLKNPLPEIKEEDILRDFIDILARLLFPAQDVTLDVPYATNEDTGFLFVELSALNLLIKACKEVEPLDLGVYFKCHRRKLQILITAAGVGDYPTCNKYQGSNVHAVSQNKSEESQRQYWDHLVAEEVKEISECASRIKNIILNKEDFNVVTILSTIVGDIQSLLLDLMCNTANTYFSKKSCGMGVLDKNEQRERCYFVEAAVGFCKLQHLNPNIPIKAQTELVVAIHDMLAEFGLCCAAGEGEKEEGTFLRFAIKYLLALDMKLKSDVHSSMNGTITTQCDQQYSNDNHANSTEQRFRDSSVESLKGSTFDVLKIKGGIIAKDEADTSEKEAVGRNGLECTITGPEKEKPEGENERHIGDGTDDQSNCTDKLSRDLVNSGNELTEEQREDLEMAIDFALDQCFYCLYGLNLRSDSSYEDDLATHKNTSRGDYQTKEQCADVFQYILPYAKASSKTGLVKLRRVLRTIRKHFQHPPDDVLAGNAIDKFLDDPGLSEDRLSEEAGSDGFLDSMMNVVFSDSRILNQDKSSSVGSSDPYIEVYGNLYYLLAQSEEISATDKWAGFVLTKEGEDFVQQNAQLFKYDLLYNPLRLESWQGLANVYDEEVDLLLNDGSKQINVLGWRNNASLPKRVEASRRRSRRCLLMTLALAKPGLQQGEIHELLALVYYDGLQNVVPIYDQRLVTPSRDAAWIMFCQNSMSHFKKAFSHKEDWSHAFYLGKLCEKLGYSHEMAFSYYSKAVALNQLAADSFYRIHASRLKLLWTCGKLNENALKVVAIYSFSESSKESVMAIFPGASDEDRISFPNSKNDQPGDSKKLEEAWHMLYGDCLSALEICVEGELKHFHKARYMLAQGHYRRGQVGDLEKAKEELSFCFRSSRSLFTINMWEIDSMVKKGRRKAPSSSGNKKVLEVNLAESSRKFITCIRKYILFYYKLLEETGDISTLDRAYISLRADKRFSTCLEDLIPVALGRYIKALISSVHQSSTGSDTVGGSTENLLEKMFALFLEQVNLWSDICNLSEVKSPGLTESRLYGYLYQYIALMEINAKVETLEGINEKIRKRLKNPKLSNSNCTRVYKHVSAAWCRSLVINLALITPLHSRFSSETHGSNPSGNGSEDAQLLCVDLQLDELYSSSFEDSQHLNDLGTKWNSSLSKIKNVIIKKVSDEDLEAASMLLRSSYSFYKDTSCALLPSGINLYTVPSQLVTETYIEPGIDTVDILDMNTSRKLLLWAYTLLHGHYTSISAVIKYCEENAKSKTRKGTGSSNVPLNPNSTAVTAPQSGSGKDGMDKSSGMDDSSLPTVATVSLHESNSTNRMKSDSSGTDNSHNSAGVPLSNTVSVSTQEAEMTCSVPVSSLPEIGSIDLPTGSCSNEKKTLSATHHLLHCSSSLTDRINVDNEHPEKS